MQPYMKALGYGTPPTTQYTEDPLNKQGLLFKPNMDPAMPQSTLMQPSAIPHGMFPSLPNPGGAQPPYDKPPAQDPNTPPDSGGGTGSAQPAQQFDPQQQTSQLMSFLNNRFQNYGSGNTAGVAPFNPGQNPFQFNPSQNPIMGQGGQAQQFSQDWMNTPSRYDTPLAKNTFDLMNQTLKQQQDASIQENNSNAASRGLFYSSVPQGTEGDIRIRTAQAQQQLANTVLQQQASTIAQDRAAALQGALGYSGQQFGQEQAAFGANLQGQGQGFQQQSQSLADLLGAGQQQFGNQLATSQFNQQQDTLNNQLMLSLLGIS